MKKNKKLDWEDEGNFENKSTLNNPSSSSDIIHTTYYLQ